MVIAALAAGLALRLWWVWRYGQTTVDGRVYGEFARNVIEHHVYGWDRVGKAPLPTLIRLPGYPLFLGVCFLLFGMENYTAVMLVQVVVDLATCLLLGGLAARMFGRRAGVAAVWMAALCPFMANYTAVPLTETWTLFCMAAAFYGVARWSADTGRAWWWGVGIGAALSYAVLLRPEQGMLAVAVVPAMVWLGGRRRLRQVGVVCVLTVLPLAPWAVRNWRVFHVIQPLAPRYATDPGDRINYGFQRWYRTWAAEFTTTETVYWNYDGSPILIQDLPDRAFDSNAQYAETAAVLAQYDENDNPSDALDQQFMAIAEERVHADPVRYYVVLPVARVLDMLFRPRTELLPVPLEWWKFRLHKGADALEWGYAGLNAGYFVLAWFGLRRRGPSALVWMMVSTTVMRSLLLLTLDNSEARYTLEFYPVMLVLGSAVVARWGNYWRVRVPV